MSIFSHVQHPLYFSNFSRNDIGLRLVNFPNLEFSENLFSSFKAFVVFRRSEGWRNNGLQHGSVGKPGCPKGTMAATEITSWGRRRSPSYSTKASQIMGHRRLLL